MELTVEHVGSFLTGALALAAVLRVVAPLTSTKRDDEAVAKLDQAQKWIEDRSRVVWPLIEVAGRLGNIPCASKAIVFLEKIKNEYQKAHDSPLPRELEAAALKIAAQLSRAEKETR
jgi:hypothetical protein